MKAGIILLLGISPFFAECQIDLKIFYEQKAGGYTLFASNSTFCPVTIQFNFTNENLNFSEGEETEFVIPEKTIRMKLGELNQVKKNLKYSLSYTYRYYLGNLKLTCYDAAYEYGLPYQTGKKYLLSQGYNGGFSHQLINALDFSMPEGTPVLAAREGVVISVIQDNTESCPTEKCANFANHVIIYHSDGTFGIYAHLVQNGAMVNQRDSVKKGDLIGYSGNTGWSSGPHLHFACYLPSIGEVQKTITTKFKINRGKEVVFLQEKEYYRKDY